MKFLSQSSLREFVVNYRHPGPRRVWKGGSEPRLRDQINGIRGITGIRGIRGCVPKWCFVYAKRYFSSNIAPRPARPPPDRPPAAPRPPRPPPGRPRPPPKYLGLGTKYQVLGTWYQVPSITKYCVQKHVFYQQKCRDRAFGVDATSSTFTLMGNLQQLSEGADRELTRETPHQPLRKAARTPTAQSCLGKKSSKFSKSKKAEPPSVTVLRPAVFSVSFL